MRDALLKTLVLAGAASVAIAEILSLFHAFTRAGVIAGWVVAGVLAVALFRPKFWVKLTPAAILGTGVLAAILAIIAYTALVYPPNSADAMAYHMPRVIYWIQNRSVAFFPTPYLNQITLQPFAEYAMAQTYLLSRGDHFVNLIQWTGFAGSILAVSLIARAMGLSFRGQLFAALICATLRNGILQASGAKNDCVVSLWLAGMTYFALRRERWYAALALGLALGTKATAYLFAPPLLLAAWVLAKRDWRQLRAEIGVLAVGVLLLNLPQYVRNYQLSGSVLGFDSAFANGTFRWRNEVLGWKPTASNVLRNISEQLGTRSAHWNSEVYDTVLRVHRTLGIDPQDPVDTWTWSQYGPPKNSNHEADANNRWQLVLMGIALGAAALFRRKQWLIYSAALGAAFLAFCFYLKWQPFFSRLELPLFVLGAPLIAALLEALRPSFLAVAVCLLLVSDARLPLLENWTRPLRGHAAGPRDMKYFNDMSQFHIQDFELGEVARVAATGCQTVGIDANQNQLEYPVMALLLERDPSIRFVHVNVTNPSRRYTPAGETAPCATIRLR